MAKRIPNVRFSFAAVLASLCIALAACEKPAVEVKLITPLQELDKVIAEQITTLVDEDSGVEVTLIPPPEGGVSILDALRSGYGDIAFATNNKRYREGITTIIPLYPSILHIASRAPQMPDTMHDLLDGSTVYAGPPGSIPRLLGEDFATDLNLEDKVVFADTLDPALVDVIMVYAPIDRGRVMSDTSLSGFTMVSLGHPDDIGKGSPVDSAVLLNPRLRPFIVPVDTYGDLTPEPIVTLAVDNLIVSREDLEDTVAYDLFAEIQRLRSSLFSERPELFQPLDESMSGSNWAFSIHPGAIDFLQRNEPTFIERYSGVAEVLVTLLVAAISGGIAVVRIYHIRRKNRIDRFYVDVIEVRDSVGPDASRDERNAAVEKIRELQNHGFELLVDEKLSADESFRIFIELSNDSIEEIQQTLR
ncbi:MAG: TAXI family TRAP transporter solute-binding subunit [Woeseiaceae bacterium]|nr:TAXI family TRAP transporter solute-binding subunit [Woeseiaceae bacterium]